MTCNAPCLCLLLLALSPNTVAGHRRDDVRRADDVSLQSLQAMVQQQAEAITSLQAEVTSLRATVARVPDLLAQAQTQVAFSVSFSQEAQAVSVAQDSPIRFSQLTTNVGQAYSAVTGFFTAPVSGLYAFFLTVREEQHTAGYVAVGVMRGQDLLCRTVVEGTHNAHWDKGSCLATVHLQRGDQVHAQRLPDSQGLSLDRGWPTAFTGFLLAADL